MVLYFLSSGASEEGTLSYFLQSFFADLAHCAKILSDVQGVMNLFYWKVVDSLFRTMAYVLLCIEMYLCDRVST